jgi:Carboxypeptidase regulatory-like domain
MHLYKSIRFSTVTLLLYLVSALTALAQNTPLRGRVSDETGAVIPGATITATDATGKAFSATSSSDGSYTLTAIPPGTYVIEAKFAGFFMKQPVTFVARGQATNLNLVLTVNPVVQQVTVKADESAGVSVDSSNNAEAVVLRGSDLDSLADNPDDLASDLQSLAGPSAGPSGSSFYIDGFSTGEMPPKDSIREIRINQNPFSPEFDKLGLGRIEIFTKPGSDKFHGSGFFNIGSSSLNSRNPYASIKAPFLLREYGTSLVGPLNKHATFTLDARGDATENGAVINGAIVDPVSLAIIDPYSNVFNVAQHRVLVTPKVDYQIGQNNTASIRYRFTDSDIPDSGLGAFNLVESAYHAHSLAQTTQFVETAILGANAVNETRFQFFNVSSSNIAPNPSASIQVLNAFTGGGSPVGSSSDVQRNWELQNITTITHGVHVWHFGTRLRATTDQNVSRQNFNGTFTFGGGTAPELDANNQAILDANGNPILVPISSIQRYQRTLALQSADLNFVQIRALGGGATQFTLSAGNPLTSASQVDLALFAADTWKMRPNLTLDLGLRYEVQNNIRGHGNFAPRVAVAWAPQQLHQKLVFRGGFGIFYDRFALANTITALRYNGVTQQQYIINNPNFYPVVPPVSVLGASQSAQEIQQNAPNVRSPYLMQTLLSVEQQLPFHTVIALSYSNTHGLHQLRSRDLNAPLFAGGPYPLGNDNPLFVVESEGLYNQNQFITNVTSHINSNISLFGSYTLGRANSNTDGITTFPAKPYSMVGEYGPSSTDVHNFATFGGSIQSIWKTTFSPLFTVASGPPFNITVGHDLYGTTLFNGRPGIASDPNKPGLIQTSYGLLDPNPTPDESTLPRNSGRGPGLVQLNMRVSKTIGLGSMKSLLDNGGKKEGAKSRYNLILTLQIRNLTNRNNPGPIIGNIASPLFGRANQAAGSPPQSGTMFSEAANNRRLEFQTRFTF